MKRRETIVAIVLSLAIIGRFAKHRDSAIEVTSRVGNLERKISLTVSSDDVPNSQQDVTAISTRQEIADLAGQATYDFRFDRPDQTTQLALQHNSMNTYTTFVTIDSPPTTRGNHGISAHYPVSLPDGVRYETAVPR